MYNTVVLTIVVTVMYLLSWNSGWTVWYAEAVIRRAATVGRHS